MTSRKHSFIFGPVVSRRLGRSLGVDLIPAKTCPYDCIYCEQGRTTCHTMQRDAYVDVEAVLEEVAAFLATHPAPDYITISGAGEPALHTGLGELIQKIKSLTSVPVAVITNGALFWQQEVRDALLHADVVLPSLDAGNECLFQKIDRPVAGLSFAKMLEGLIAFRNEFSGALWLEVFLMDGINDDEDSVREIAAQVRLIRPDIVQINTVERPPAMSRVKAVSFSVMERYVSFFEPEAEIISPRYIPDSGGVLLPQEAPVLEMLRRRPCPLEEIAEGLGFHRLETAKLLDRLVKEGRLCVMERENKLFFGIGERYEQA